jgi:hypothetical protein
MKINTILNTMADLQQERSQVQRMNLHRVMIDTPALLNMVKHCREADIKTGARGQLKGVLKDSIAHG